VISSHRSLPFDVVHDDVRDHRQEEVSCSPSYWCSHGSTNCKPWERDWSKNPCEVTPLSRIKKMRSQAAHWAPAAEASYICTTELSSNFLPSGFWPIRTVVSVGK